MISTEIQPLRRGTGTESHRNADKAPEKVVVAIKAEKEISRTALSWTLAHVARPGDSVVLLAVLSGQRNGKKVWSFPTLAGDCGSGYRRRCSPEERRNEISECCSRMLLQFQGAYDPNQIKVKIKVVSAISVGVVAAESKRAGANWVVLDKQLRQEEKSCMEELQCNIVVMRRSQPKVLRLNLGELNEPKQTFSSPESSDKPRENRIKHSTPVSSPEEASTSLRTTTQASMSSFDVRDLPLYLCERNPLFEVFHKRESSFKEENLEWEDAVTDFDSDEGSSSSSLHHPLLDTRERVHRNLSRVISERSGRRQSSNATSSSHKAADNNHHEVYWIPQNHIDEKSQTSRNHKTAHKAKSSTAKTLLERFTEFDREAEVRLGLDSARYRDYVSDSNVRKAVSLCRSSPSVPPPLCSICQHKAPTFGKPPRWFSYLELEEATNGFSKVNFLAEGGFGSVHRGVLGDGQVVAVKQLKVASSQGDAEFCAEVEVLSCAQHRNVVMLIGFCLEGKRRVLVYEYICNGSLDLHLYGRGRTLDWQARVKIATGAARGLRYLHEDCRVGCIVHRDMRPNNILVTHDFEPLVGDFGLARWHPNGNLPVETRVIGTFGYLAPEYAESGKVSEKADVYAFGVVLLELITGRKAVDLNRPKGQQFLIEWARPFLSSEHEGQTMRALDWLLDPRLGSYEIDIVPQQLLAMARAAMLCLRRDPHSRPSMSKILKVIEGDTFIDPGLEADPVGSTSSRMTGLRQNPLGDREELRGTHSRRLSLDALKAFYTEKEYTGQVIY